MAVFEFVLLYDKCATLAVAAGFYHNKQQTRATRIRQEHCSMLCVSLQRLAEPFQQRSIFPFYSNMPTHVFAVSTTRRLCGLLGTEHKCSEQELRLLDSNRSNQIGTKTRSKHL